MKKYFLLIITLIMLSAYLTAQKEADLGNNCVSLREEVILPNRDHLDSEVLLN